MSLISTVAGDSEEGMGGVGAVNDIHASGCGDIIEDLECSNGIQEVATSDTSGEGAGVIVLLVVGIVLTSAVGVKDHAVCGLIAAKGAKLSEFGGIRGEV